MWTIVLLTTAAVMANLQVTHGQTYLGSNRYSYKLDNVQDVWLEGSANRNNWPGNPYLIIGKHPQYPLKRSLVQTEDPPSRFQCQRVICATLYVYYAYAHKASWHSDNQTPNNNYKIEAHQVRKPWNEAQATSINRVSSNPWASPYLKTNNPNADAFPKVGEVDYCPVEPRGWFRIDVTPAVRNWIINRHPNHGLLLKVNRENVQGRDLRFFSNGNSDASTHAYINVQCYRRPFIISSKDILSSAVREEAQP